MGKFVVKRRSNGEYQFNLLADTNQIILQSHGFTVLANCLHSIEMVKALSQYDSNFDRRVSSNGQYYFVLTSNNGEIIGISDTYASISGRENGIRSVQKNAHSITQKLL